MPVEPPLRLGMLKGLQILFSISSIFVKFVKYTPYPAPGFCQNGHMDSRLPNWFKLLSQQI